MLGTIYEKVFNQGQADLYPGLVRGPYIQQPRVPCELKRIAVDGDLASVHVRYLDWGGQESAGVDIFRFDADGTIVEHWGRASAGAKDGEQFEY